MVRQQMRIVLLLTRAASHLFAADAQAEEKEPSAIVEIGGADEPTIDSSIGKWFDSNHHSKE